MNIENLRVIVPCERSDCPAATHRRVPTQAEINALAEPDYEAAWRKWSNTRDGQPAPDRNVEMFREGVDALIEAALGGGT